MKAALLQPDGTVAVAEHPAPVAAGHTLVRVKAAGVCGTEIHFLDGLLKPDGYPFIMGHEFAGVVEDIPPGETRIQRGDRVTVYNLVSCGVCRQCGLGRQEICDQPAGQMGFNLNGGFAELVRVPAGNLVKLPDTLDFETAALLACSGMAAMHGVRMGGVSAGSTVVVNGVGGVGLMVMQAAALSGAEVIAVGDSDEKLELAKGFGAACIRAGNENEYAQLPEDVLRLTGSGADFFFELVGTTASMAAGFGCLGKAGTFVSIGYTTDSMVVSPIQLIIGEQRVVSCVAARKTDLEDAVRLAASGKLKATVQQKFPIENIGEAFSALRERRVLGRNVIVFD